MTVTSMASVGFAGMYVHVCTYVHVYVSLAGQRRTSPCLHCSHHQALATHERQVYWCATTAEAPCR